MVVVASQLLFSSSSLQMVPVSQNGKVEVSIPCDLLWGIIGWNHPSMCIKDSVAGGQILSVFAIDWDSHTRNCTLTVQVPVIVLIPGCYIRRSENSHSAFRTRTSVLCEKNTATLTTPAARQLSKHQRQSQLMYRFLTYESSSTSVITWNETLNDRAC